MLLKILYFLLSSLIAWLPHHKRSLLQSYYFKYQKKNYSNAYYNRKSRESSIKVICKPMKKRVKFNINTKIKFSRKSAAYITGSMHTLTIPDSFSLDTTLPPHEDGKSHRKGKRVRFSRPQCVATWN